MKKGGKTKAQHDEAVEDREFNLADGREWGMKKLGRKLERQLNKL